MRQLFAGHIGAGLAIARAERGVNVGLFIAAALLLDVLLWLFVLLGWESVAIPADFPGRHQPEFVFPYSHGLLASLAWAGLAGAAAVALYPLLAARWRAAALVALAVLSHWVLDALVHRPELPLAGAASRTVGLGFWSVLPFALVLESGIALAGLWLFLSGPRVGQGTRIALGALSLVVLMVTIAGMTLAPAPPSARAMAGSSLVTLVVVCAIACWIGRRRRG